MAQAEQNILSDGTNIIRDMFGGLWLQVIVDGVPNNLHVPQEHVAQLVAQLLAGWLPSHEITLRPAGERAAKPKVDPAILEDLAEIVATGGKPEQLQYDWGEGIAELNHA